MFIKTNDMSEKMRLDEANLRTDLIKEATDLEITIEFYIREKYSLSQEVAIHRKKLLGELTDEEWNEYNDFVKDCIERAKEKDLIHDTMTQY